MYSPFPFCDSNRVPAEYMSESLPPAHCLYRYQNYVVIFCWKFLLKTVPWLRQLVVGISPRIPGFDPRALFVGFVVDKLALGQGFNRVLLFSAAALTARALHSDISLIRYRRWGTRWRSWLRQSREVAGLIPDDVIAIFHWHNPFVRSVALGSTQSLKEMSTNTSLGVKAAYAYGWQPCHLHVPTVWKTGSLDLLESSGHVQACRGMAKNFRRCIILATDVSDRKIVPPPCYNFKFRMIYLRSGQINSGYLAQRLT
jgi:hypothetical protein